ncbi:MAG: hypothetical protein DRH10_00730 [Deltaproteobacteria bacterium]|nr:MAG: hypothetical protein DRH10_00730 [Deltaproteobacteria bacterium]RLC88368.1 MAG: hypothetical protein DRJ03_02945 [Chloroflexota bacterium]
MWNLSSKFQQEFGKRAAVNVEYLIANTISFTDNSIDDSAGGLGNFVVGDFVRVVAVNNWNIYARVIAATANKLTFAAGTFAAAAAGGQVFIETFQGGSFAEIIQNGRFDLYTGTRPGNADEAETGTKLAELTLNGSAFVSGVATNGINLGVLDGNTLKRAIDPATGAVENWAADGLANGTAGWGRWYSNTIITGASTVATRMDGTVTTAPGGDIVMLNGRDIVSGAPVASTDINVTFAGM